MILLTVGAQMPFDRLVRAVDAWAARNPEMEIIAQIGRTDLRPMHLRATAFIDPVAFRDILCHAELIVTHAGMGTILSALEAAKPILVMPRRGDLLETRNDHQFGTARAFQQACRVAVAWDENELDGILDRRLEIPAPPRAASHASFELLASLRQFIHPEETVETQPASAPTPHSFPGPSVEQTRRAA